VGKKQNKVKKKGKKLTPEEPKTRRKTEKGGKMRELQRDCQEGNRAKKKGERGNEKKKKKKRVR